MDDNEESLGECISRLRGELSINQLARQSRTSVSNLYKIENSGSVPSRETTEAIAAILDPDGTKELLIVRDAEELVRLGYDRETATEAARRRSEQGTHPEPHHETRYERVGPASR